MVLVISVSIAVLIAMIPLVLTLYSRAKKADLLRKNQVLARREIELKLDEERQRRQAAEKDAAEARQELDGKEEQIESLLEENAKQEAHLQEELRQMRNQLDHRTDTSDHSKIFELHKSVEAAARALEQKDNQQKLLESELRWYKKEAERLSSEVATLREQLEHQRPKSTEALEARERELLCRKEQQCRETTLEQKTSQVEESPTKDTRTNKKDQSGEESKATEHQKEKKKGKKNKNKKKEEEDATTEKGGEEQSPEEPRYPSNVTEAQPDEESKSEPAPQESPLGVLEAIGKKEEEEETGTNNQGAKALPATSGKEIAPPEATALTQEKEPEAMTPQCGPPQLPPKPNSTESRLSRANSFKQKQQQSPHKPAQEETGHAENRSSSFSSSSSSAAGGSRAIRVGATAPISEVDGVIVVNVPMKPRLLDKNIPGTAGTKERSQSVIIPTWDDEDYEWNEEKDEKHQGELGERIPGNAREQDKPGETPARQIEKPEKEPMQSKRTREQGNNNDIDSRSHSRAQLSRSAGELKTLSSSLRGKSIGPGNNKEREGDPLSQQAKKTDQRSTPTTKRRGHTATAMKKVKQAVQKGLGGGEKSGASAPLANSPRVTATTDHKKMSLRLNDTGKDLSSTGGNAATATKSTEAEERDGGREVKRYSARMRQQTEKTFQERLAEELVHEMKKPGDSKIEALSRIVRSKLRDRKRVVEELRDTERSYVLQLQVLVDMILRPLRHRALRQAQHATAHHPPSSLGGSTSSRDAAGKKKIKTLARKTRKKTQGRGSPSVPSSSAGNVPTFSAAPASSKQEKLHREKSKAKLGSLGRAMGKKKQKQHSQAREQQRSDDTDKDHQVAFKILPKGSKTTTEPQECKKEAEEEEEVITPEEAAAFPLSSIPPDAMVLSLSEIKEIFGDIEVIYGFHCKFLSVLEEKIGDWSNESCIGPPLIEKISFLKIYAPYLNKYMSAMETLCAAQKNPHFQAFLARKELRKAVNKLSLEDLLVTPIQRVPRYRMLCEEILKHTPKSHKDYDDMLRVVVKIRSAATELNEMKRHLEAKQYMFQLQTKIIPQSKSDKALYLPAHGRKFLLNTKAEVIASGGPAKPREVILFNNLILVVKPVKGGLHIKQKWFIEGVHVIGAMETAGTCLDIEYNKKKHRIIFKEEDEKNQWLREITNCCAMQIAADTEDKSLGYGNL